MLFCPPYCGNNALPEGASLSFTYSILILCTQERLCMNRVRSLLSKRGMLLGYNFEPRPNSCVFATVYSRLGITTIGLSKPVNPVLSPPLSNNKPLLSIKHPFPPLHDNSSQTINVD